MTEAELKMAVYNALATELQVTEGTQFNSTLLTSKIKTAYNEVKRARNYPGSYSQTMIDNDMSKYESTISDIALYDYNLVGAEGQESSTENGVTRHYVNRDSLFYGVIPLAR